MLSITVPPVPSITTDLFDDATQRFIVEKTDPFDGAELLLEHSLVSLSKWEEITEKPFIGRDAKTREETVLYIKCMTLNPVSDPETFKFLTSENFQAISDYLDRKMTATIVNEVRGARNTGEFVTAEIIYYWMVSLNIPFDCQYWHLNKLIALVRTINAKNQPQKKTALTRNGLAERRALAEQRRRELGTAG